MSDRAEFDPGSATDPQLFVLGRLAHLREFDFGDPDLPAWVIRLPLGEEPYEMSSDRIDRCIAGLVERGLVGRKGGDAGDGTADEPRYWASDACMAAAESIRHELRARHPVPPDELAAQVLLFDAIRSPEGFDRDLLQACLEEPPGALTADDAAKLYRRMMRDAWIFATKRPDNPLEWFPAPKAWAWRDGIAQALESRLPEMRARLVQGVAAQLQIAEGSPLHRALEAVDRAHFVPEPWRLLAYRKRPIPVALREDGTGRTNTSSPDVCAIIAQTLELKQGDQVLICGVKGGYTAALCAHVVGPSGRVECLEDDPAVAEHARQALARAGFDDRRARIHLVRDVTVGRESQQQWDAAVVNGKVPKVPRAILKQMAAGGRLLIFLQEGDDRGQTAYLIKMDGKAIRNQALSSFLFTPIFGEFGFDPPNWQENLELVGATSIDVFISYSTRDQESCSRIAEELEAAGLRCWYSARDHPLSRDGYAEAIISAIEETQLFVILLSHDSLESAHVSNELAQATNRRKAILPVRLRECPPRLTKSFQYHLERHQHVDLATQDGAQVVGHALALLQRRQAKSADSHDIPDEGVLPGGPDTLTERFRALLDAALADGRITVTELEELCQRAIEANLAGTEAEARQLVIARARAAHPDVAIEPMDEGPRGT
jgi:protein-L-isoaspartate O-methyltransferase